MARFKLKKENYSFVVSDDPEDYCTTCDNPSITRPQRFIPLQGEQSRFVMGVDVSLDNPVESSTKFGLGNCQISGHCV